MNSDNNSSRSSADKTNRRLDQLSYLCLAVFIGCLGYVMFEGFTENSSTVETQNIIQCPKNYYYAEDTKSCIIKWQNADHASFKPNGTRSVFINEIIAKVIKINVENNNITKSLTLDHDIIQPETNMTVKIGDIVIVRHSQNIDNCIINSFDLDNGTYIDGDEANKLYYNKTFSDKEQISFEVWGGYGDGNPYDKSACKTVDVYKVIGVSN